MWHLELPFNWGMDRNGSETEGWRQLQKIYVVEKLLISLKHTGLYIQKCKNLSYTML
jgi:hypothetical protein